MSAQRADGVPKAVVEAGRQEAASLLEIILTRRVFGRVVQSRDKGAVVAVHAGQFEEAGAQHGVAEGSARPCRHVSIAVCAIGEAQEC